MHSLLSDNAVMIPVSGIITEEKIASISQTIKSFVDKNFREIVLDFSSVTHIHYLDVPLLEKHLTETTDTGVKIHLAGMSPYVENLLMIGGISKKFIEPE